MQQFLTWFGSSVGKKQIVAFSGLGLAIFTLSHMAGNLLMFLSPRAYNLYGHSLVSNPAFPLIEATLALAFIVHIVLAIQLSIRNRNARPMGYASWGSGPKRTDFAARSMALTGLLVLSFLILHIITFKYGAHYVAVYDGMEVRDLYKLIHEKFQEPIYVAWYVLSLVVLAIHLSHGISSVFQSLGLFSARTVFLRQLAWAFSIVVAGGFITQPLWIFCCGGTNP
jgi:succinate dehydrogenase / fumarate reductase, cytochrome b subunit